MLSTFARTAVIGGLAVLVGCSSDALPAGGPTDAASGGGDASHNDAASPTDAGDVNDAGSSDVGATDAAAMDAGATDAAAMDAAAMDAGATDARPADGSTDAGIPPPASIVIGELSVAPASAGFVELAGPAMQALAGYELLVIAGSGQIAARLSLTGALDADGLYLVAHPSSTGGLRSRANMLDGLADLPDGPDSLQLRFGSAIVDAVGWGDFSSASFAGEGRSAAAPQANQSLSRNAALSDTDDNFVDFHLEGAPSPGEVNTDNVPPTAQLDCPLSGDLGASLAFDASGSLDPDGNIIRYDWTFAAASQSTTSPISTHSFSTVGRHLVEVRVTDDRLGTARASCNVSITEAIDEAPTASFVATSNGGTRMILDASSSSDDGGALEYRWDLDGDGGWDTAYAAEALLTHDFGAIGSYIVNLEVRDSASQTAQSTRTVRVGTVSYESGTITTRTWSGVIVVQADVLVPAGEVLTVDPGTQVLITAGATGRIGFRIDGALQVNGTAAAPVVFSIYGSLGREPSAWEGIDIRGEGSSFEHAIIEYADEAINTNRLLSLDHVTLRLSRVGLVMYASVDMESVEILDNLEDGVQHESGSHTLSIRNSRIGRNGGAGFRNDAYTSLAVANSEIFENGEAGLILLSGETNVLDSRIFGNGTGVFANLFFSMSNSQIDNNGVGLAFSSNAAVDVSLSTITEQRYEGILLRGSSGGSNLVRVWHSNIFGNGREAGPVVTEPDLHAFAISGGSSQDDEWVTPNGMPVQWIRWSYHGNAPGSSRSYAAIRAGRNGPAIVEQRGSGSSGFWADASRFETSELYAYASGYSARISCLIAHYRSETSFDQVAVLSVGATADFTNNYWGGGAPTIATTSPTYYDASNPSATPVPGAGL